MTESLPTAYSPSSSEAKWYAFWEEHGLFEASADPADTRDTYMIAIPPPNITGTLHMGHACRTTFEDVLTRYHRMRGLNTLWLPGTDHAGIATQVVVERILRNEGISRYDLGREKFLERVWQWKEQSGGRIVQQLKKMGASCDWSRHKFTMDPDLSRAVREAFVRLYEEGLIYRGLRMVNWDVATQTVLSDLEVDQEENVPGELYEFAYLVDGSDEELVVATTRPETMLGDTAIAVHPDDERYAHLHGKHVKHPFVDRRIPIITDSILVDMELGTGAVKITPAHDPNDFAAGRRHDPPLEEITIFNLDGTLNEHCGEFEGMTIKAARKAVRARLNELGLERGVTKHKMTLPRSQRSGEVVEPMLSEQWFVKMEPLAKPAIEVVRDGTVKILPADWEKTYFYWLENIQDWCISRQLWWGHEIPAWHCADCGKITVARETPTECQHCQSKNIEQDADVLDTWFSSALWPFSTLGWPDETPDLKRFYPTQDMETGYDILFFWVARMIIMGLHFMGEVPFNRVLLAGLVTDERGQKMSKVKGNVIDPLDVIDGATLEGLLEKAKFNGAKAGGQKYLTSTYPEGFAEYGTDALRMTLLSYSPMSRRIALSLKRVDGYRKFANKLWNAARYALMRIEALDVKASGTPPQPTALANRWILSRLHAALEIAEKGLDEYRLDEASGALYHFVWDELCDWFLELSKPLLDDEALREETAQTLVHVLETTLRALHPMMPFITEEIWHKVAKDDALGKHPTDASKPRSLIVARYPSAATDGRVDADAERDMNLLTALVTGARTIRAEHDLTWSTRIAVHVHAEGARRELLESQRTLMESLFNGTLHFGTKEQLADPHSHFDNAAVFLAADVPAAIPDVIDVDKERERIERALKKLDKELIGVTKKLSNPSFVDKAPPEVVAKSKTDEANLKARKAQLEDALARLS